MFDVRVTLSEQYVPHSGHLLPRLFAEHWTSQASQANMLRVHLFILALAVNFDSLVNFFSDRRFE